MVVLAALVAAMLPTLPASGAEATARVRHRVIDGLPTTDQEGLSPHIIAPIPFSLVGVSVPEGARVRVRTSDAAGSWTPWVEAEAIGDDGPDPGSAEAAAARPGWQRMSEPLWVGDASRLQIRVLGGDLDDVAVHLFDSLGLSRSPLRRMLDAWRDAWRGLRAARAHASDRPPIVSRSQWGADESLRGHEPHYSTSVRAGILHHTAGANDYTPAQAPGVVRAIYAYHTRSLGWSDIGYNLLVDRYGTIYEGRAGGLDRGVIGAHAGGFNAETFGVSILGEFTSELPPGAALESAVRTVAWKFRLHGINADPNATVDMTSRGSTRYPEGQRARLHTLSAHRDVSATACPGDVLYASMPEVRRRVFAHAPPAAPPAPADPHRGLPLPDLGLPLPDLGLPGVGLPEIDAELPQPEGERTRRLLPRPHMPLRR